MNNTYQMLLTWDHCYRSIKAEKILFALREEVRCARYKNECLMKEEKEREEEGVGLYRTRAH